MKSAKFRVSLVMTAMLVFLLACNTPTNITPNATEPASDDGTILVDVEATEAVEATENAPAAEVLPSVQHTDIPVNLPEGQSGQAGDFDSSKILETKTAVGGDRFTFGRFERPFNANTMDVYFSEIDIVNTEVFQDDLWIYGRLSIKDLSASGSTPKYAVEIDSDLNGKADWLIVSDKPTSTDWTVAGVRVYQDANQNVGGEFPMLTDNASTNTDGFEVVFFDQGAGENPDTAWVRISPNDTNIIEFAINRAAISKPEKYLINYWAGHDLDPAKFDLNDIYSHEQAGAADQGLEVYYPIKEVAEVDNSCRMAVGFKVTGTEPGLCDIFIPQILKDPVPGAPSGCQATQDDINACIQSSVYAYWDGPSCSCKEKIPG